MTVIALLLAALAAVIALQAHRNHNSFVAQAQADAADVAAEAAALEQRLAALESAGRPAAPADRSAPNPPSSAA